MKKYTQPKLIKVTPNQLLSRVSNTDPATKKKCMAQMGALLQRLKHDDLAYDGVSEAIAYYHAKGFVRPVQLVGLAYLAQEQGVPVDLDVIGMDFSTYDNRQEALNMTKQGLDLIWGWIPEAQRTELRGLRNGDVPKSID